MKCQSIIISSSGNKKRSREKVEEARAVLSSNNNNDNNMTNNEYTQCANEIESSTRTKKVKKDHQPLDNVTSTTKQQKQEERKDIRKELTKEKEVKLPDPSDDAMSPDDYTSHLVEILCGYKPKELSSLQLDDYFSPVTDEQILAYDMDIVSVVRDNDIVQLKQMYHNENKSVDCCNRYGESLLHMACRRGFEQIGTFFLDEASLNVRIRDDCGRTPFHDICWNHAPNLILAEKILKRDPALLLLADKRGHTPFQYARPQDWSTWRHFLHQHYRHLIPLGQDETRQIFASSTTTTAQS